MLAGQFEDEPSARSTMWHTRPGKQTVKALNTAIKIVDVPIENGDLAHIFFRIFVDFYLLIAW